MRNLINFIIVLAIGLIIGGVSSQMLIRESHGIGAIQVGPWSAWPFVGGEEVDPYTVARATADGTIPLGAAEGLTFEASSDQNGSRLDLQCRYEITGKTPAAKLWTLSAYTEDGELVKSSNGKSAALLSSDAVRYADFSFKIEVGDHPSAGNWIPLSGDGGFKLILRLYDTPITSNAGVLDPDMPKITLKGCNN